MTPLTNLVPIKRADLQFGAVMFAYKAFLYTNRSKLPSVEK